VLGLGVLGLGVLGLGVLGLGVLGLGVAGPRSSFVPCLPNGRCGVHNVPATVDHFTKDSKNEN